jgi:(2Fe-2S) ferredoxin
VAKIYRLAVCKGPNCTFNGADELFRAAVEAVKAQGLQARCLVARGGCYGMCAFGPNLILRSVDSATPPTTLSSTDFILSGAPDELHYSEMTADRAGRLIAEHVGRDSPIAEWLHVNRPKSRT